MDIDDHAFRGVRNKAVSMQDRLIIPNPTYSAAMTTQAVNPGDVFLFTDGACSCNPGKGGYGVVILQNNERLELSGGFNYTTNNRMELMGAIAGLKSVEGLNAKVTVYSDSKYVVDMFNGGHAEKWRKAGWTRNKGKDPVKNPDLWHDLLVISTSHAVKMVWVRGHASNPENARCDELAVMARQGSDLPEDEGYENSVVPENPGDKQLTLFEGLN